MQAKRGFTLIELMVVFAVIGILASLATPTYRIYQQRAYGSYAQSMLKLFLDAQIMYFLEHNKFFPEDDVPISVMSDDLPGNPERQKIKDALHIEIPVGSKFNYFFYALNNDPKEPHFRLIIQSEDLPLYQNGYDPGALEGIVNNQGTITISTF